MTKASWWESNRDIIIFGVASFLAIVAGPATYLTHQAGTTGQFSSSNAWWHGKLDDTSLDSQSPDHGRALSVPSTDYTNAFSYYTKTDMQFCLENATDVTEQDMKAGIMTKYGLSNSTDGWRLEGSYGFVIKTSGSAATVCFPLYKQKYGSDATFTGDNFHINIYNVASGTQSASDIASTHVDAVYNNKTLFFEQLSDDVNEAMTARLAENQTFSDSTATPPVEATASNFYLASLGFTVIWPSKDVVPTPAPVANVTMNSVATAAKSKVWFPWWAWLLYAMIPVCCCVPLCLCLWKRRKDLIEEQEEVAVVRKPRKAEGLNKIYGPQWGMTEVDFDGDYMDYNDADMQGEYARAHKLIKAALARNFPQEDLREDPSAADATAVAWGEAAGAQRGDWATPRTKEGDATTAPRRFDIDDIDDQPSEDYMYRN